MTTAVLIGAGLFFLFLVLFVIWGYNSFIVLDNRIKNALGQINVQLKRRIDLIPNLVETVKGYAKHEKTVFENVTKARTSMISSDSVGDKLKSNNALTAALKTLFAVAENYPKLQANENFINLQNELSETEDKIAYARQFYNDTVLIYNNKVQMFPTNVLARLFGFRTRDSFTISAEEAEKPEVHF